ncbi:uncharacterized protein B0T15DRAFT_223805 [Chaetomium strumarium]|uniref:Uncharacterized protein n=1 Tax=Chaetomium strumarium TaxID=1170767 RepID=A0AAJ0LZZ2_9PEZI|nr:hypothetical protein B0T15DRAFT_223805 [Chaetomium strumarium]
MMRTTVAAPPILLRVVAQVQCCPSLARQLTVYLGLKHRKARVPRLRKSSEDERLETRSDDALVSAPSSPRSPEFPPKCLGQQDSAGTVFKDPSVKIRLVALRSSILDSTFIQINTTEGSAHGIGIPPYRNEAIPLESYQEQVETSTTRDDCVTLLTQNGFNSGALSGTPSFIRLPGSRHFKRSTLLWWTSLWRRGTAEVGSKFSTTRKLLGHVVAGSPTTGLTFVTPAARVRVFAKALLALSTRSSAVKTW